MEEVVGTPIRRFALIVRQVVRRGLEREPRLSPPQPALPQIVGWLSRQIPHGEHI